MQNVFRVQEGQSLESFKENVRTHVFRDGSSAFFDHWSQTAPVHKFKENPESLLKVVSLEALDDSIRAFCAHFHDSQLVSDNFSFFFVFRFNKL